MGSQPTLTVTSDFTEDIAKIISSFKRDVVLVGIPAEEDARDDAEIGNAQLLAMMVFGSPANNIPPWNVISIGIQGAAEEIAEQFKVGAKKALEIGDSALEPAYNRIGIIASTGIKKALNSQQGVPTGKPERSTLMSRKRIGFKGTKYWLVTGQLRNAITYVINKGGF